VEILSSYILSSPRATVDLDFTTKKLSVHGTVKAVLEESGKIGEPDISYRIIQFEEITQQGMAGASVQVEFKTNDGARNLFNLDIFYAIGSEETELESPMEKQSKILISKIEGIIADKIISSHRFKGGNTRMKDFDDLGRISRSGQKIEGRLVRKLTNHLYRSIA